MILTYNLKNMMISVAIVSKKGELFCMESLPSDLKQDIANHARDFLYALSIEDDDVELPYIETPNMRYIYKQTEDLYWILVTKPESDMFTDIKLLGKFVCTIMEYGDLETNSQTITDQQRDLFYRHIWRPWDEVCLFCDCHCGSIEIWQREFESRLQFLNSIRDGDVDEKDTYYFNGLINEAWAISAKLSPRWDKQNEPLDSDSDSVCSSAADAESISEENLIDGCRLKCRLEDIRLELNRIQDPYLRLFARRDLLSESDYCESRSFISSAPTYKDINLDGRFQPMNESM